MTVQSTSHRLAKLALAGFAGAWLALVAIPPVVFMGWRETRLADVSGPAAQEEWDAFRAEMREQSGERGPVKRKVPRSPEPPERVWLRDYPEAIVVAWVTFVGLLGAAMWFLLRGALGVAPPRSWGVNGRG